MRLQKFGHSCLLVESGDGRVLVDPGTFSQGFEQLDGLTAVLVTHQHPDHLDVERLRPLLDRNPQARLITDAATAEQLGDDHGIEATAAKAGESYDVGLRVEAVGEQHAEIHRDLPRIPNVGYVIDGRLLHPGDAIDVTDVDIEVLALPAMAPWMRMADAIDYLRAVSPRVAVPIHEALLRNTDLFYNAFRGLGPDATELKVLDGGEPVEL
jgi:L-ascorbate metabolism protein UlaG (beta-lactamase superfamily)